MNSLARKLGASVAVGKAVGNFCLATMGTEEANHVRTLFFAGEFHMFEPLKQDCLILRNTKTLSVIG